MNAQYGTTGIPRYWITLGKETLWDYPRQFVGRGSPGGETPPGWPYTTDISEISTLIRGYLETPRPCLLTEPFTQDQWGLINILRAADRRIGSRQWEALEQQAGSEIVRKILTWRKEHKTLLPPPAPLNVRAGGQSQSLAPEFIPGQIQG